MTRYEAFHGHRPNMQEIRLLPIFSVLLVYRRAEQRSKSDPYDQPRYIYGLYVGREVETSGNIRVAINTDKGVRILVTSKYKAVTEGAQVDFNDEIDRSVRQSVKDGENISSTVSLRTERDFNHEEEDEDEPILVNEVAGVDDDHTTPSKEVLDDQGVIDEKATFVPNDSRRIVGKSIQDKSEYDPSKYNSREERAAARTQRRLGSYLAYKATATEMKVRREQIALEEKEEFKKFDKEYKKWRAEVSNEEFEREFNKFYHGWLASQSNVTEEARAEIKLKKLEELKAEKIKLFDDAGEDMRIWSDV